MKPKIYRNLDKKYSEAWSIEINGSNGKVSRHRIVSAICYGLTVGGLTSGGFEACVSAPKGQGRRRVFAWFRCDRIDLKAQAIDLTGWERVYFNPKDRNDKFFHTSDGARVESACEAVFSSNGEMFIK